MDQKLKTGSVQLEAAFTEWVKGNAYNPSEAIDHFMERSEYVLNAIQSAVEDARDKIAEFTRQHLTRLSEDTIYTAQFPMVYAC